MKEKYNIVISERQAVPRSKRMREKGQSASSAAVLVSGAGEILPVIDILIQTFLLLNVSVLTREMTNI